jgi:hypothetical protein
MLCKSTCTSHSLSVSQSSKLCLLGVRATTISKYITVNKYKLLISLHSSRSKVQLSKHEMSAEAVREFLQNLAANST